MSTSRGRLTTTAADRLRDILHERRMSQRALAANLGVGPDAARAVADLPVAS